MVKKLYNYPAHAVRVFERAVQEQAAMGRSLRSLTKGFFLGTGVSLRFEFADTMATVEQRLTYFYGRRRDDSDRVFQGWRVSSVLPMRAFWITIGYFYLLQRAQRVLEKEVHNLATLIYLAIEAECDVCHRQFAEPEGAGEAALWDWAQKTAAAAYEAGWRDIADRPLCPECISRRARNDA